jgi:mono/diheme cytochrome c family protein
MPDVDGHGELGETGSIAVLQDTDGDGVMDRRTVFADGLVLPRAVLPLPGGALFIAPPKLWFGRDRDGDLRCDERVEVDAGFDAGLTNPEHAGNSPLWGLDNQVCLANHPFRYRWSASGFRREPTAGGGQWGLSMDDSGRLWFDYNSDWLRMDRYAGQYGIRHPHLGTQPGLNLQVVRDQSTWPVRVTPGINRGYQPAMLREGRLASTTACCAPLVYRGEALAGMQGNVFVCEPAGNLVRRFVLSETATAVTAANPYPKAEFLASTDERFRPVNLQNGPDGALYVVDMYRGLIQHRNFVTTWLRQQVIERRLEQPTGLGRIWRIVPEGWTRQPPERLSSLRAGELVQRLRSGNGQVRDQCQQLLVTRGERAAVAPLRALAREAGPALPRLHALWTLHGMDTCEPADLYFALRDGEPLLRAAALRMAEPFLRRGHTALGALAAHLASDPDPGVRLQLALSLGEVPGEGALDPLVALAASAPDDAVLRAAIASGLYRKELPFLRQLCGSALCEHDGEPARTWLRLLARLVTKEPDAAGRQALFDFAASRMQVWQQVALLQGAVDALQKGEARRGSLQFAATPQALASMQRTGRPELVGLVQEILAAIELRLPATGAAEGALDAAQQAVFAAGAGIYGARCAVCHQPNGRGMQGLAPPLRDSEWVLGPADRPVRIVLQGLSGPLQVGGEKWELEMPAQTGLGDAEVAAVLTFVRNVWGHRAGAVAVDVVAQQRKVHGARKGAWTAAELMH